jgi:uncharacterized protein DUF6932
MIPAWTPSGVLPPFLGPKPTNIATVSPYAATMLEVAQRFATSAPRVALLRGLIAYRKAFVAGGFTEASQWINGSFVEDVETARGRPPGDIDIVTLFIRPPVFRNDAAAWSAFVVANRQLFDPPLMKAYFHCDGGTIDVGFPASRQSRQITYWHSLFSHQRVSFLWKGMLQVPISSDDDNALLHMSTLSFPP